MNGFTNLAAVIFAAYIVIFWGAMVFTSLTSYPFAPREYVTLPLKLLFYGGIVLLLYALRLALFALSVPMLGLLAVIRRFVTARFWDDPRDKMSGYFWSFYALEYKAGTSADFEAAKKKHQEAMAKSSQTIGQNNTTIADQSKLLEAQHDRIKYLESVIELSSQRNQTALRMIEHSGGAYKPWDQEAIKRLLKNTKNANQAAPVMQPDNLPALPPPPPPPVPTHNGHNNGGKKGHKGNNNGSHHNGNGRADQHNGNGQQSTDTGEAVIVISPRAFSADYSTHFS